MIQQGLPLVKQDLSPPITGWLVTWLLFFIVSGTIHTLKMSGKARFVCPMSGKARFVCSISGKARVCVFNVRQSQGLCVQWCTSDRTSWHFCSPLKWCRSHPERRKKLYLVFFMLELHACHTLQIWVVKKDSHGKKRIIEGTEQLLTQLLPYSYVQYSADSLVSHRIDAKVSVFLERRL